MNYMRDEAMALGPGWAAFANPESWLSYAAILLLATGSGAILAYHPVYRRRPLHTADLEQRKTLMIYAAVGALIAVICATNGSMAFVIFGIGGLMRFRTDVGASKSTGHTIMATLIGLCWGFGLELVATFATAYFWGMIYILERTTLYELIVGGVELTEMGPSADAYRNAIDRAGGRVTAHEKSFKRKEMTFVIHLPPGVDVDDLTREAARIPFALRGTPHWPEA